MKKENQDLVSFIWKIANQLRGPYRPPQYRRVMLPMTVLRRMDCVLEPTKDAVLAKYKKLLAQELPDKAIEKILGETAAEGRKQPLYNTSPFTFKKLLGDPDNIARNLISYIKGFSPTATEIFERFNFEAEIEKLDNANRLFLIIKEFSDVDLHPDNVSNMEMGLVFEELVRRFNEQANEEAGDHFTPREVIRLMTHIMYTEDEDVYKPGIVRTIYDPTCGTGGMLSASEEYIKEHNPDAHLLLFGQEYNDESYAICASDLLIKDEPIDNIAFGDTLGDGKTFDGHPDKKFHYMLANPPFGVEWRTEKDVVEKEHKELGFSGRFGPGLPRINDGALLFLLHMISKMQPSPERDGEGSKIAIIFNGSPLFTGDAGSGESNIRRWIIENDMLDAVIALPDQLFYNTGIFTYIWIVTNRKQPERTGKVQLIDGTKHFEKMKKSLNYKRNKLSDDQINDLTRLYADYEDGGTAGSNNLIDDGKKKRVCSKIFDNREFGFLKVTVDRPLKLNFQASPERIERLKKESAFQKLAESKKRKDKKAIMSEEEAGKRQQEEILRALETMDASKLYKNRDDFEAGLKAVFKKAGVNLEAAIKKAILSALSEQDPTAAECTNSKGEWEPDPNLRDTEIIPLPANIPLPLPLKYDDKAGNEELLGLVHDHCETYMKEEVLPHVPDAKIDYSKTKVGYEIPLNRHFYVYEEPRPLKDIESDIKKLEKEIVSMLQEVAA